MLRRIITLAGLLVAILAATSTFGQSQRQTFYAGTGSGSVKTQARPTYASAHDASAGDSLSNSTIQVGQIGVPNWSIMRGALVFNTASLPDDATITKAELHLHVFTKSAFSGYYINIVSSSQSNPNSLVTGDYSRLGASHLGDGQFLAGAFIPDYNIVQLNALGRAAVSKTGWTLLGLRDSRDVTNNASSTDPGFIYFSGATSTSPPYLVIEYTQPVPQTTPQFLSPAPGTTIDRNQAGEQISFSWTNIGATQYQISMNNNWGDNQPEIQFLTSSTSATFFINQSGGGVQVAPVPNNVYSARLTAYVSGQWTPFVYLSNLIIDSAPPVPTPVSPTGGPLPTRDRYDFEFTNPAEPWGPSPANAFQIQIARDQAFSQIVHTTPEWSEAPSPTIRRTVTLPSPLTEGAYYWRARAKKNHYPPWSAYTSPLSFSVSGGPPAPTPPTRAILVAPTNGSTGKPIDTDLQWTDDGSAASFGVYFGTSSSSLALKGTKSNTGGTLTLDPGILNYNTTYYWKIESINAQGSTFSNQPPGTLWQFTTEGPPPTPTPTPIPTEEFNGVRMALTQPGEGEPVNTATGNFYYSRTDVRIPSRGFPFEFTRTYNVMGRIEAGSKPLGYGWTHNFNVFITENTLPGEATIHWGDGRMDLYEPTGPTTYRPVHKGYEGELTKPQGGTFEFKTKNQITYEFDSLKRLVSIADRNGNTMTLSYEDNLGSLSSNQQVLLQITDTVGRPYTFTYNSDDRITALVTPLTDTLDSGSGRTWQFQYDMATGEHLTKVIYPRDPSEFYEFEYDALHRIVSIKDRLGIEFLTNVYDPQDRVTDQKTAKQDWMHFSYNDLNGVTTFTDTKGETTQHAYDALLRVQQSEDELGHVLDRDYDANNRPTNIVDSRGNTTQHTYDEFGNRTSTTNAVQAVSMNSYNAMNDVDQATDELNRMTQFQYEPAGNLLKIIHPDETDMDYEYDGDGQLTAMVDAEGRRTEYGYNPHGDRTLVREGAGTPDEKETTYEYDNVGRMTKMIDADGNVTEYRYDKGDNVIEVDDPLNPPTVSTFDANGNRLSVTNPRGFPSYTSYDVHDLVSGTTDTLGNETRYFYDEMDRLEEVEDARGGLTRTTYDAAGRVVATSRLLSTSPDVWTTTTLTYDPNGNRVSETNGNGHTTFFSYDRLNRLVATSDPIGNVSYTTYDAAGRMTQTQDPNGNVTRYQYDALDRVILVTDAEDQVTSTTYDQNGNRIAVRVIFPEEETPQGGNHRTDYTYDDQNRLKTKTDALGNTTTYDYNNRGLLETRTDGEGQVTAYTHDALGRVVAVNYTDEVNETPDVADIDYDENSNRTRVEQAASLQRPGDGITQYTYDELDRLETVTDPFDNVVGYEYDEVGNRTRIIYPDGKSVIYAYDLGGRLTKVEWDDGVSPPQTIAEYEYDLIGNVTNVILGNGAEETRAYDGADRLIGIGHAKPSGGEIWSAAFTLDADGNHINHDRNDLVGRSHKRADIRYAHDDAEELKEWRDLFDGVEADPDASLVYDDNGNMTSMTEAQPSGPAITTMFTYDAENRLIRMQDTTGLDHKFKYNADGHRLEADRNGDITLYVLDPNGALENVLCETDGLNAIKAYYIHGLGLLARVDGTSGEIVYYHGDQIGSTMAITDDSANVVKAYNYDEFGAVQGETGSLPFEQRFQFVGRFGVMTETADLLFMRARYYQSRRGTFLAVDQIEGQTHYTYAGQHPLTAIDPAGTFFDFASLAAQRSSSFLFDLIHELDKIQSTPLGNRIIGYLDQSTSRFIFEAGLWGASTYPSYTLRVEGSNAPTSRSVDGFIGHVKYTPSLVFILAHELTHLVSFATHQFDSARTPFYEEFANAIGNIVSDQYSPNLDPHRMTYLHSDVWEFTGGTGSEYATGYYMNNYSSILGRLGLNTSYPTVNLWKYMQSNVGNQCSVGARNK